MMSFRFDISIVFLSVTQLLFLLLFFYYNFYVNNILRILLSAIFLVRSEV